eukprot:1150931-Pelagomonas_calceolata.AAC.3
MTDQVRARPCGMTAVRRRRHAGACLCGQVMHAHMRKGHQHGGKPDTAAADTKHMMRHIMTAGTKQRAGTL